MNINFPTEVIPYIFQLKFILQDAFSAFKVVEFNNHHSSVTTTYSVRLHNGKFWVINTEFVLKELSSYLFAAFISTLWYTRDNNIVFHGPLFHGYNFVLDYVNILFVLPNHPYHEVGFTFTFIQSI